MLDKEILKKLLHIANENKGFLNFESQQEEIMDAIDEENHALFYDYLNNYHDKNLDISARDIEKFLLFEENQIIKVENVNNITGFPLFIGNNQVITFKEDGDACDSFVFYDNDEDEESYKDIFRPSHHNLISEIIDWYTGYEDSFKYRLLLSLLGYHSCFLSQVYKGEIYFDDINGNSYLYKLSDEFASLIYKTYEIYN